jgi:DNA-binding MarR family transcriptional regulator/rubrerythrin
MMDLLRRFTDKPGPDGTATAKGLSMIRALKTQGRIKKEAASPRSESTYTPSRKRQELLQKIADLDDKILAAGKGTPERKNLEAEEERLTKELQAVYKTGESTTQKTESEDAPGKEIPNPRCKKCGALKQLDPSGKTSCPVCKQPGMASFVKGVPLAFPKQESSGLYLGKPTVEPKVGMRVAAIDGPGQSVKYSDRQGVITKKLSVTGKLAGVLPDAGWEVKLDGGGTDSIHGSVNTDPTGGQGIGWYRLQEDSNTLDKDEQRALQYFKDEGWHTYSDASEMGASLGINYGRAKTILQSLIARKLIVRNPHGYDTYAIDESGGDADAELRAKYSERQKLAAKHDLTADDQRRVAQLDRQIRDLRQLLARRESKEEPTRDTDGKFSGSGSTAKKKPYKSPYSQLSQAHKDKFDAKFPGPGMKEDKENPIPGEEVPHNYYEWPHVGWEKQKARIAKGMSVSELHYARIDCDKAARANPGTDTESKYRDEGSIYAQELRRRGGK